MIPGGTVEWGRAAAAPRYGSRGQEPPPLSPSLRKVILFSKVNPSAEVDPLEPLSASSQMAPTQKKH